MDLQDGKRMLGDIKSKLGFGSKDTGRDYDDGYYDDYDDYADGYDDGYYDEGGYDDYDDAPASRSSRYGSYSSSSSRDARPASSSRTEVGMPRLVSIEDVRASTRAASSQDREASSSRYSSGSSFSSSSSFGANRTMVDSSLPPQMTPEGTAAQAAAASGRRISEGLDSLFTPTTGEGAYGSAGSVARPAAASASPSVTARPAYDPFESYSGASSASYSATRSVTVLKPASYAEVERVSKSLKAGDAVVLCLGNTNDALAKRILDFSFGVASALDASVECIADKVFAVTRGKDLTETERATLRSQGVL